MAWLGSLTHADEQTHVEVDSQADDRFDVLLLSVCDLTDHPKDNSEGHLMAVGLW